MFQTGSFGKGLTAPFAGAKTMTDRAAHEVDDKSLIAFFIRHGDLKRGREQ
jgi:hypothetical protein